jgi:hypothetical protein
MLENGLKAIWKAKELRLGLIIGDMKENSMMVKKMEKEVLYGMQIE